MSQLSPEIAAAMRKKAQEVRERQQGNNYTKSWSLSGKNAIVESGKSVIMRLMPRWDYANSMTLDPATQQRVPNPAYKPGHAFVVVDEHWWDVDGGKTTREWCPGLRCPICDAASAMMASASKEDREYGKRIGRKEVFIFNAVVDNPRRVDDGLADIRPVSLVGTLFNAVSDIMTGGDKEQFARGDITHPRDGYDLVLKRPVKGGGDRWAVDVAPQPTPLYGPAQAAAFKGWVGRLTDLEAMVKTETRGLVELFKAFWGRDPDAAELRRLGIDAPTGGVVPTGAPGAPTSDEFVSAASAPTGGSDVVDASPVTVSAPPPQSPDDEFMMPPPRAPQSAAGGGRSAARPPRR